MRVDPSRLSQLRDEVGMDVFAEVIEMSLEEMDEAIKNLAPATAAKLHFLKGSALNTGMADFSLFCAAAERDLKADLAADVDLPRAKALYDESRQALLASVRIDAPFE